MNDWLKLILSILACYRLVTLITFDEGPFEIFHRLRIRLGAYDYGSNGEANTNIGRGMTCPHCVGIWTAMPLALIAGGIQWYAILWWLAIAGGSNFLWSLRDER